jgi:asparagine synthase (glutamine-hydrolysing)
MSMANGLEVRVPLLGKELLKFAEQIQPELQNHKELKFLLKKLVSEYIPQNIMNLKKSGFTPPLLRWSKSILKEDIIDTILSNNSFSEAYLNKNEVKKLVDSYYTGNPGSIESLWTLYSLKKFNNLNQ